MAKGAIATSSPQPSFDDIIQAGRKKKQAETLANRLLGSGRRASAPTVLTGRKAAGNSSGAGSLASRAGISKTSAANSPKFPTSFKTAAPSQPRGPKAAPLSRSASNPQLSRKVQALGNVLGGAKGNVSSLRNQVNLVEASTTTGIKGRGGRNEESEINIRGKSSGPFTVRAQNFAPGTTAADIETVLVPERDVGALVSCNLLTSNPTVIAELVFTQKHVAESVIAKYNNKKADGRLLYVYMFELLPQNQNVQQNQKLPEYSRSTRAPLGTYDQQPQALAGGDDYMELEVVQEPARVNKRSLNSSAQNHAQPDYRDGTQGFPEPRQDSDQRRYNNSSSSSNNNNNHNGSSGRGNGDVYDSYKPQERYRDGDGDGGYRTGGLQSDRMMGQQRNNDYNSRPGQAQWQGRGGRRGY